MIDYIMLYCMDTKIKLLFFYPMKHILSGILCYSVVQLNDLWPQIQGYNASPDINIHNDYWSNIRFAY